MKQDPVSPALLLHGCHALWVLSPSSRGAGPPAEVGGSVEAALRSCKVTSFHSEHPGPIGHTADPAGGSGAAKARLGWWGGTLSSIHRPWWQQLGAGRAEWPL